MHRPFSTTYMSLDSPLLDCMDFSQLIVDYLLWWCLFRFCRKRLTRGGSLHWQLLDRAIFCHLESLVDGCLFGGPWASSRWFFWRLHFHPWYDLRSLISLFDNPLFDQFWVRTQLLICLSFAAADSFYISSAVGHFQSGKRRSTAGLDFSWAIHIYGFGIVIPVFLVNDIVISGY